jgi:hypothetical protein
MTPERLARIRALYEQAVEMDTSGREALLDRECREQDLRREVELLLGAREHVPGWLNEPPLAAARREAAASLPPVMEGRLLGGYRIVREIGRGGMGSVYLAERSDGAFHKQAAIKLVKSGMNTAEIVERFRRERDILASLDHPNIARLLDGGTTEDGLPYFVMEYVDGQPILRWCNERKLSITQRLELFEGVCAAVQYAHQRLVVHRDLKPANILVTSDGKVKLLDFGIAKLLGDETTGEPVQTQTMLRLLTPDYASPEQVIGDNITTLSDVYSLGVVLYELLTGQRPYHLLSSAMHEVARIVAEEEPTRPSVVVASTEAALRKRLEGDLDSITMTALQKQPTRRYTSVESFKDDIRRHLEKRPVMAREDSVWYRLNRFVHRNPGVVAAGALLVVSMFAGLLTTLWELRMTLDAGISLPRKATFAPLIALFVYIAVAVFGIIVYFTRAPLRRIMAALLGGGMFALITYIRFRVGLSMGWWQSGVPEAPDIAALLSFPIAISPLAGAMVLLISWRISRRFGAIALAALFPIVGVGQAFRERVWYDRFMHMMVAAPGIVPLLADGGFIAAGFALGYAMMRLVAGPADQDQLARSGNPLVRSRDRPANDT